MNAITSRTVGTSATGVVLLQMALLSAGALLLLSNAALTAEADSSPTPQELVAKLQAVGANAAWEETEVVSGALTKLGETALPAIEEGLAKGDNVLSGYLLGVLGGIPGDGSTSLLVSAIPTNASALGFLENREVRRPLSEEEFGALEARVKSDNVIGAGTAARVLAKCIKVPADLRVGTVLPRFVQAVVSPTPVEPVGHVYVSPRVYALNQFLLAFSYIGEPAVAPLQAQRAAATDPELHKWLTLALGRAGEAGVAGELEEVVKNDPDRYVRWTAVRAYARSAGAGAISLLRSLLTDETESEYYRDPFGHPYRLIAGAARAELSRLELGGVRP